MGSLSGATYVLSLEDLRESSNLNPVTVVPSAVSVVDGHRLSSYGFNAQVSQTWVAGTLARGVAAAEAEAHSHCFRGLF
jgi:hypothetical protein